MVILPEFSVEIDRGRERILEGGAKRNRANPLLDFPVTLGTGSTRWSSGSTQTMEQVLIEADRMMYEDKRRSSGKV